MIDGKDLHISNSLHLIQELIEMLKERMDSLEERITKLELK